MTVLVAIHQLSEGALVEAREACKTLGLETADWTGGIPRVAAFAVISGLGYGVRRIPDDLMALLDATPGLHLVLCAQEPLVKQQVVIGDGRICVLGPPIGRAHIITALRAAILPQAILPTIPPAIPPARPIDRQDGRHFEVLRRSHWIAWARGRAGPAISLHEQRGATVVIGGASHDRAAIADVMVSTEVDEDREAALGVVAGSAGVAHLTHAANEWVVYWPLGRCPLWIYSPHRVPARWNAARGIAAVANRRLLRLPAFPEDQLVAAWSDGPSSDDTLAPVHRVMAEGGSETLIGLDDIASRHDHITGVVMEVR